MEAKQADNTVDFHGRQPFIITSWVDSTDEAKLQEYLINGYTDTKLDVSVLMTCHGLPVSEIFVPIMLCKDTDSSAPKETGKGGELSSYKELFFNKGVLQRKILLVGKAGAGKSTFCKHLTDIWCSGEVSPQFVDAEVLRQQFRFLFSVSCRFAEASETVFDMICNQLFCEKDEMKEIASQVLKNTPDECLVVMDGIDEWKGSASKETGRRGDIPGLPSRIGLEDCVVLSTSRPERIHMLPTKLDKTCSVLELDGIINTEELICSVLIQGEYYDPWMSCLEFLAQIRDSNMTDLIRFPLLLINALNIWDMNGTLSSSMSVNYANMVEGLFQRAKEAGRIEEHEQGRNTKSSAQLPVCFCDTVLCKRNAGLIIGLGFSAFDLMFRNDQISSLTFSRRHIRAYLTESKLQTSLAIGILSKAQTFSRSSRRIDSFSFCHKTFQEFLGALWLSTDQSEGMSIFLQHFKSTNSLYNNRVVIQFLCGLSHSAGDEFWQCIVKDVIEKDEEIQRFRLKGLEASYKVQKLQNLVLMCIKEARNSDLEHHRQLYYFIPDIYIGKYTGEGEITLINSLVEKYVTDIKSVTVDRTIPLDIIKFMKQMHSAISVRLDGDFLSESVLPILQFPQQLKKLAIKSVVLTSGIELPMYLTRLTLLNSKLSHSGLIELLSCLRVSSTLQHLWLSKLHCCDHGYGRCLPALDLQGHHSLETLKLRELSVEHVLLPDQGTLPLPLTSLSVCYSKMSHSGLEQLFSRLRVASTLQDLWLWKLYCSDHDDSCCLPALDLQGVHSLETVRLRDLSVQSVLLPVQLERQQTGGLIEIPTFDIFMSSVKMPLNGWGSWLDILPHLPYKLKVCLWRCNTYKDLKSYIRSCAHFTVTWDGDFSCKFETKQGHDDNDDDYNDEDDDYNSED